MNAPITITGTMGVYLPSFYSVKDLFADIRKGDNDRAFGQLSITESDMSSGKDPWPRIGTAEVSVTLASEDEAVQAALQALNKEMESARAEWLQKQQVILEKISKLSALTYESRDDTALRELNRISEEVGQEL